MSSLERKMRELLEQLEEQGNARPSRDTKRDVRLRAFAPDPEPFSTGNQPEGLVRVGLALVTLGGSEVIRD